MYQRSLLLLCICVGCGGSSTDEPSDTPTAEPSPTPHDHGGSATATPPPTGTPPATATPLPPAPDGVNLRRTSHGVIHVTAPGYDGLGYGVAYAYTEDNRCLLAHRIAQVNGRLSEYLGADAEVINNVHDTTVTSLHSDAFYRGWFDQEEIRAGFEAGSVAVRQMAEGYARGVNAWLYSHPGALPCEVGFNLPVTRDDVYRMWVATATIASGELLEPFIATAAPETNKVAAPPQPLSTTALEGGSNAWAIGRDGGEVVHLYNPHFPWAGIQRLYLLHLTLPGELDVFGVALGGFPVPLAGFNEHMVWGLTFSTAARFTVSELKLTPGDPFTYVKDGESRQITEMMIPIQVKGEATPRQVPFYHADGQPLLDAPAYLMGWSKSAAYAVHDINRDNTRIVEQFIQVAKAHTVAEVKSSLAQVQGVPWSYTLAADDQGEVLFADIGPVPPVDGEDLSRCSTSPTAQVLSSLGIFVLDGQTSSCDWSGLMPDTQQPWTIRTDYVANSNNNFELPNVEEHLTGFSPLLGASDSPLALRPGMGLTMIEDRLTGIDGLGAGGFTAELAQEVFFSRRNRAAELLLDGILEDCLAHPTGQSGRTVVDLTEICAALASWDRLNNVDSQGAHLFDGMWAALKESVGTSGLFLVPASLNDPLGTPSGYTTDATVREGVRNALARVVLSLQTEEIGLTSAWGPLHSLLGQGGPIPTAGGSGEQGLFDVMVNSVSFYSYQGWVEALAGVPPETVSGASYLHVVSFGESGPEARGLLTYSQATEVDSPWFEDQLDELSTDGWFTFPFREEDILGDPQLQTYSLP